MPITASQKGRIIEQLIGAILILQSDGVLRVSLPLVDDEGVDLVVGNRLNEKTLLLQIKGRFGLSGRGHYRTNVRRATCSIKNHNKFLLLVYYDKVSAALGNECWLIHAPSFCRLLTNQKKVRPNYIFDSRFTSKNDMWMKFRIPLKDMAKKILEQLN